MEFARVRHNFLGGHYNKDSWSEKSIAKDHADSLNRRCPAIHHYIEDYVKQPKLKIVKRRRKR